MRAVLCTAIGGPDGLVLGEVESRPLKAGEARIKVHACGVNFADTLIIQGKYQVRPEPPFTPGIELAGVVAETAPDVTRIKPGQRVLGMMSHGAFAEEAVLPAKRVIGIPDAMDFTTAAAFPVAYGTSHVGLGHRAGLKAGEVLLVHGASGGVGLTAVEIGKAFGATVIATASSAEKLAIAKAHGADHVIDYSRESVRDRVKALTGGADVVYDPVGGAAFDQSLRCINWEGRMLVIGFASGHIPQVPANLLLVKNCAAVGVFWGAYLERDPMVVERSLATLFGWWAEGKLKPHVSERLPLAEAGTALKRLTSRRSTGKIVLDTGRG